MKTTQSTADQKNRFARVSSCTSRCSVYALHTPGGEKGKECSSPLPKTETTEGREAGGRSVREDLSRIEVNRERGLSLKEASQRPSVYSRASLARGRGSSHDDRLTEERRRSRSKRAGEEGRGGTHSVSAREDASPFTRASLQDDEVSHHVLGSRAFMWIPSALCEPSATQSSSFSLHPPLSCATPHRCRSRAFVSSSFMMYPPDPVLNTELKRSQGPARQSFASDGKRGTMLCSPSSPFSPSSPALSVPLPQRHSRIHSSARHDMSKAEGECTSSAPEILPSLPCIYSVPFLTTALQRSSTERLQEALRKSSMGSSLTRDPLSATVSMPVNHPYTLFSSPLFPSAHDGNDKVSTSSSPRPSNPLYSRTERKSTSSFPRADPTRTPATSGKQEVASTPEATLPAFHTTTLSSSSLSCPSVSPSTHHQAMSAANSRSSGSGGPHSNGDSSSCSGSSIRQPYSTSQAFLHTTSQRQQEVPLKERQSVGGVALWQRSASSAPPSPPLGDDRHSLSPLTSPRKLLSPSRQPSSPPAAPRRELMTPLPSPPLEPTSTSLCVPSSAKESISVAIGPSTQALTTPLKSTTITRTSLGCNSPRVRRLLLQANEKLSPLHISPTVPESKGEAMREQIISAKTTPATSEQDVKKEKKWSSRSGEEKGEGAACGVGDLHPTVADECHLHLTPLNTKTFRTGSPIPALQPLSCSRDSAEENTTEECNTIRKEEKREENKGEKDQLFPLAATRVEGNKVRTLTAVAISAEKRAREETHAEGLPTAVVPRLHASAVSPSRVTLHHLPHQDDEEQKNKKERLGREKNETTEQATPTREPYRISEGEGAPAMTATPLTGPKLAAFSVVTSVPSRRACSSSPSSFSLPQEPRKVPKVTIEEKVDEQVPCPQEGEHEEPTKRRVEQKIPAPKQRRGSRRRRRSSLHKNRMEKAVPLPDGAYKYGCPMIGDRFARLGPCSQTGVERVFCYNTFGLPRDPAMVLISGLGSTSKLWPREFCAQLAATGLFVVCFDNRDAGLTTHWDGFAAPSFSKSIFRSLFGSNRRSELLPAKLPPSRLSSPPLPLPPSPSPPLIPSSPPTITTNDMNTCFPFHNEEATPLLSNTFTSLSSNTLRDKPLRTPTTPETPSSTGKEKNTTSKAKETIQSREAGAQRSSGHLPQSHGRTVAMQKNGEYILVDMAQDTLDLMTYLGISTAHLLGTSMGGMIAQDVALLAPDRVKSLSLLSTHCPGSREESPHLKLLLSSFLDAPEENTVEDIVEYYIRRRKDLIGGYTADTPKAREMFRVNITRSPGDKQASQRQFNAIQREPSRVKAIRALHTSLEASISGMIPLSRSPLASGSPSLEVSYSSYAAPNDGAQQSEDPTDPSSLVLFPVAVIHGKKDRMIPVANGYALHRLWKSSTLHVFDNLGHNLPDELVSNIVAIVSETVEKGEERMEQIRNKTQS